MCHVYLVDQASCMLHGMLALYRNTTFSTAVTSVNSVNKSKKNDMAKKTATLKERLISASFVSSAQLSLPGAVHKKPYCNSPHNNSK